MGKPQQRSSTNSNGQQPQNGSADRYNNGVNNKSPNRVSQFSAHNKPPAPLTSLQQEHNNGIISKYIFLSMSSQHHTTDPDGKGQELARERRVGRPLQQWNHQEPQQGERIFLEETKTTFFYKLGPLVIL